MYARARFRRRLLAGLAVVSTAAGLLAVPAAAGSKTGSDTGSATELSALGGQLRTAVDERQFVDVVDYQPTGTASRRSADAGYERFARRPGELFRSGAKNLAPLAHQTPNVDTAVIELDPEGRPVDAANVLLSPNYPQGAIVPLTEDLETTAVRWGRWSRDEWNTGSTGSADLVEGRDDAGLDQMATYPASMLKLMVGFGVLRLVDRGDVRLHWPLTYEPSDTSCGEPATMTIEEWFDLMITVSDNRATCSLIKLLHDRGAVNELNQTFRDLGLPTLQLTGTNPDTGGTWIGTSMTSMETARLLLVVGGSPGVLWHTPTGEPVRRNLLSASSRSFFYEKLADQGLNHALSTSNWCGREYPAEGIIQRVPERWIDPSDGTVTVDGRVYGQDVRPCNQRAEVTFAHKTGLTNDGGTDAGIIRSVQGAPQRQYIVVVSSNLGLRYGDANRPEDPPGIYPVPYTEKLGQLGAAIDNVMSNRQ